MSLEDIFKNIGILLNLILTAELLALRLLRFDHIHPLFAYHSMRVARFTTCMFVFDGFLCAMLTALRPLGAKPTIFFTAFFAAEACVVIVLGRSVWYRVSERIGTKIATRKRTK